MKTYRHAQTRDKIQEFKRAAENGEDTTAALTALDLLEGFLTDVERIANALDTIASKPAHDQE